jgi:predicted nucleic acid-binding protein
MDTGFWYASIDKSDRYHQQIARLQILEQIIVPVPVITETAHLVNTRSGTEALARFSENLARSNLVFEAPVAEDYIRAAEILRKYDDQNLDFVDVCIVAIAERLRVTKILTIDRRHFSIFKPSHCDSFELLPE